MYVYFNENGELKEVINDKNIRKGSNLANRIYIYLENHSSVQQLWFLLKRPNQTLGNEINITNNTVNASIPYDKNRDMKYFRDFVKYDFYYYDLTDEDLETSGLGLATIREIIVGNSEISAKGMIAFNIEANVIKTDNNITQSQYDYLISLIDIDDQNCNNYSIAYNLVVNRNGYQMEGYKFDYADTQYVGYTVKQFQTYDSQVVKDEQVIKSYLSYMTGHERIPVYCQDKPSDEFLILTYDDTIWKLQYDETNGLLAFKVENLPSILETRDFALNGTISETQFAFLQKNKRARLLYQNQYYYLMDDNSGYLVYVYVSTTTIKSITIDKSTRVWEISEREI